MSADLKSQAVTLYDRFTHGLLERREFMGEDTQQRAQRASLVIVLDPVDRGQERIEPFGRQAGHYITFSMSHGPGSSVRSSAAMALPFSIRMRDASRRGWSDLAAWAAGWVPP